jgi:hypothetical protein
MEFDGALGEVQGNGDFFVCEITREAIKDFFFTTRQSDLIVNRLADLEQFVGFFEKAFQLMLFGRDEYGVIAGRLSSNHAVHCQQAGRLISWESTIRTGLNMKIGDTRSLLIEKVATTKKACAGTG